MIQISEVAEFSFSFSHAVNKMSNVTNNKKCESSVKQGLELKGNVTYKFENETVLQRLHKGVKKINKAINIQSRIRTNKAINFNYVSRLGHGTILYLLTLA